MSRELKMLLAFVGIFLVAFYLPLSDPKVTGAIVEAFKLLQWYARNHILACVVPALSLPSLLVIRSVLGNVKTAVFAVLLAVMATIVGLLHGAIA